MNRKDYLRQSYHSLIFTYSLYFIFFIYLPSLIYLLVIIHYHSFICFYISIKCKWSLVIILDCFFYLFSSVIWIILWIIKKNNVFVIINKSNLPIIIVLFVLSLPRKLCHFLMHLHLKYVEIREIREKKVWDLKFCCKLVSSSKKQKLLDSKHYNTVMVS